MPKVELSKREIYALHEAAELIRASGIPADRWGLDDGLVAALGTATPKLRRTARSYGGRWGGELAPWPAIDQAAQAEAARYREAEFKRRVWAEWNALPDGTMNAVYVIASKLHATAREVGRIVYPEATFGPYTDRIETSED